MSVPLQSVGKARQMCGRGSELSNIFLHDWNQFYESRWDRSPEPVEAQPGTDEFVIFTKFLTGPRRQRYARSNLVRLSGRAYLTG
jgi:hypothetical protein